MLQQALGDAPPYNPAEQHPFEFLQQLLAWGTPGGVLKKCVFSNHQGKTEALLHVLHGAGCFPHTWAAPLSKKQVRAANQKVAAAAEDAVAVKRTAVRMAANNADSKRWHAGEVLQQSGGSGLGTSGGVAQATVQQQPRQRQQRQQEQQGVAQQAEQAAPARQAGKTNAKQRHSPAEALAAAAGAQQRAAGRPQSPKGKAAVPAAAAPQSVAAGSPAQPGAWQKDGEGRWRRKLVPSSITRAKVAISGGCAGSRLLPPKLKFSLPWVCAACLSAPHASPAVCPAY